MSSLEVIINAQLRCGCLSKAQPYFDNILTVFWKYIQTYVVGLGLYSLSARSVNRCNKLAIESLTESHTHLEVKLSRKTNGRHDFRYNACAIGFSCYSKHKVSKEILI